ncbi:AraC family transcriptional regulator [Pseudomonas syringae pv. aceris]|nr:AraC family transcriptional regulator [Pseudomonas syringae pv. aceris]
MPPASQSHPMDSDIGRLAGTVSQIIQCDGDQSTAVPGMSLHRRNAATKPIHCVYGLGVGVTLQGCKQVVVGEDILTYAPGQSMVTSIDLPVISNVIQASFAQPFLGMILTFDASAVMQIAERQNLSSCMKNEGYRPITVHKLDGGVLSALERLIGLLTEPTLITSLAPLIKEEIIVRLLNGVHGPQLLHVVSAGSPSQHIAKAVTWLKQNYRLGLGIDDLAATACMTPSTFRHHFRAVTGMSPLQFQKQLRLQAARQLMLNQNIDASDAGGIVGYESPSQFSREYSRLFGEPPQRDIRRMRLQ